MARTLQLEDLLQGLQQEGEYESQGTFSLDVSKAAEKMRSFQLPNAYFYCLKWVQAAVLGGASSFQWRSDCWSALATIEGFGLRGDWVPRLPTLLFEPQVTPAARQLAAGMNAVVRTRARQLMVSTWDGQSQAVQARWTPRGLTVEPWKLHPQEPITVIRVIRNPTDSLAEMWYAANHFYVGQRNGAPNARDREHLALHARAALAPIQLDLSGYLPELRLDYRPPLNLAERMLSLLTPVAPNSHAFRTEFWFERESGQPGFWPNGLRLALSTAPPPGTAISRYVALPRRPHPYSQLFVVKEGLLLDPISILEGRPGVVFICDGASLNVDLSGFEVIRDKAWEALLDDLGSQLELLTRTHPLNF